MITKNYILKIKRISVIFIIVFMIFCVKTTGFTDTTALQIGAYQIAANTAASYLLKNTYENGMFNYRVNMDPNVVVKEKYNILRHSGTIYAMSMYYQMQPDDNMKSAIERAGRYLQYESIHPVAGMDDLYAVWSEPEVNQSGNPLQSKLGGTGLGLVALLSIEKFNPGFTPLSKLQALGRFIVFMQKENGSFYSKYIPSEGGRWDEWQSLYYPGEAALGLLMLYEKDPSNLWLVSATKALMYLALSRKNSIIIPADHWALLATEKILSFENVEVSPVSKELLISHAVQISNAILQDQIKKSGNLEYDGGFSVDGRTTPTATRMEGLQATLKFLPPDHELRKRIDISVQEGISFLVRAQIDEGEFTGALPRAIGKIDHNIPDASSFNRRSTEVRIDYVQHALSAIIQYLYQNSDNL